MSAAAPWARRPGGLSLRLGATLVALLVGAAALSLVWTPFPPGAIDIPHKLLAPSAIHWLGTDALGHDVASQILAGARVSILVGVIAVGIGLVFGVGLGLLAAAAKGVVEEAIMKLCDFTFAKVNFRNQGQRPSPNSPPHLINDVHLLFKRQAARAGQANPPPE